MKPCSVFIISLIFHPDLFSQNVDTLVIPEVVPYSQDSFIRHRIKKECRLEEKISQFIQKYNESYRKLVFEAPQSGAYHVLKAEIIEVVGRGGGIRTGAKSITIEGQLTDETGKILGTFKARRYSGGGAFGGYKGTCAILGRCTKAIGKDVAFWLRAPGENSALGDF